MKASQKGAISSSGNSNKHAHKNNNSTLLIKAYGRSDKNKYNDGKVVSEKQGPTDWSCFGLKSKYRGEREREEVWQLWKSANQIAVKSLDQNFILPVVKIDRHPFYIQYYKHLSIENSECLVRTKSRLLMKRFVFDVQEVWLTNLEHLREHNPVFMYTNNENSSSSPQKISEESGDNLLRGNGLDHRRDVKSIESMDSQIQSVSQKRAFSKAYHTARLPSVQIMLDYVAAPTPYLRDIKCIPPTIEPLIRDVRISSVSASRLGMSSTIPDLYSQRKYPDLFYVLHIDRLLPSVEFVQQGVVTEVLWRFTLFCSEDSTETQVYECPESSIAAYVAEYIFLKANVDNNNMENNNNQYHEAVDHRTPYMLCSSAVYNSPDSVILPFSVGSSNSNTTAASLEIIADLSVAVIGFSRTYENGTDQFTYFDCKQNVALFDRHVDDIHAIKIEICVRMLRYADEALSTSIRNDVHDQRIFLECSPPELRHLLHNAPCGSNSDLNLFSLSNIHWWLNENRNSDLWPYLSEHLILESPTVTVDTASYQLRFTTTTIQRQAYKSDGSGVSKVRPEQVPGALSTLEALSCAYELLETIRLIPLINSQHSLMLVNSSTDLLSKSEHKSHLDSSSKLYDVHLPSDSRSKAMSAINPIVKQMIADGLWEGIEDSALNSSMILSSALQYVTQVPGSYEYGRKGLWWTDQNTAPKEYTQAAVKLYRETRASSTKSVLVNVTYALDSSKKFPVVIANENFSTFPQHYPAEEIDQLIPVITIRPLNLLSQKLVSPVETRLSSTMLVFSSIGIEGVDFMPRDTPTLPKGYKKHVPVKNMYGFREQIESSLLNVDPMLSTMVFGITRTGAVPNNTGVNNRNIWHNTLAITEFINRPRVPKDYHYILVKTSHQGPNEGTRYTTRMKADKMVGLTSSAFSDYEDKYNEVLRLRDLFNKQLALDEKIEKVENDIKVRDLLYKKKLQTQLQRALEKKVRKSTKSERGWRGRFRSSTIMEIQGNWERRRDDRSGMFFFRNTNPIVFSSWADQRPADEIGEKFAETCQWEVPAHWDGDPLSTDFNGGKEMANYTYPGGLQSRGGQSDSSLKSINTKNVDKDQFDMAPKRWDPNPPQHVDARLTLPTNKGPFEQPPDHWIPQPFNPSNSANAKEGSNQMLTDGSIAPKDDTASWELQSKTSSVNAEKSLANSIAPTIDTANLEHIAEQLVSSDELMRVIARRLGLPESQVVPADDLSSVFSIGTKSSTSLQLSEFRNKNPHAAPRDDWLDPIEEDQFDSDDDMWSDEEHEVGDFDEEVEIGAPEDMPNDQREAAGLRRKQRLEEYGDRLASKKAVPSSVPPLELDNIVGKHDLTDVQLQAREELYGWRRLPRPVIRPGFLSDALQTHTKPPDITSSNTLNKPIFLMPISPVDACKYIPEASAATIESIFIPNAKKDIERSIATMERNVRREEELSRNMPTDDLLLFGQATEMTSVDAFLSRQLKEDQNQVRDPREVAMEKAILAAKSSNIAMMEDSLAEEISINTADDFGNTLLILACQQGNKRMVKFLLRRGANINLQSLAGNTPLHYCYAYSFHTLGAYLKAKGADDSIVNVDGLTCYEGLNIDSMNEVYGDDEDALMLDGGEPDSDND